MHFELSPLIVWIALWIEKIYSEFQVSIFSNNRDITKCQSFCPPDAAKAIAIPQVFSENSLAKNAGYQQFSFFPNAFKSVLPLDC